ncbi:MAG: Fic family protein [bacterium]|nr:Fic family protein [bacterium]
MDASRYETTQFGRAKRTLGPHSYVAYFPEPLPRSLALSQESIMRTADAEAALGRLAGAGRLLGNPQLLIYPYLRREAVSSTRIEGTQASLSDIFDAEADGRPASGEIEEVVNYIQAMELGIGRLPELPLSLRLMCEMHSVILTGVRGAERLPGEVRRTQNWVGNPDATVATALFVPPPPEKVGALLSDLERFIHDTPQLPPLVQTALVHYQFETIHPFLDGNGRLGRLLIVFFLIQRGRLQTPLLYLSSYFEAHRDTYYETLQGVRERGDFESWLQFFLRGVEVQAGDAITRSERLMDLREQYRQVVLAESRGAPNALVDLAFQRPFLNGRMVETGLGISRPSALRALERLENLGLLHAAPEGPRRQRRWVAVEVMDILTGEIVPENS